MTLHDERIITINEMVGFNQINGIEITEWQDGFGAVQLRITENH